MTQSTLSKCVYGRSYNNGCRCDDCRARATEYMKRHRRKLAERQWGHVHPTTRVDVAPSYRAVLDARYVQGIPAKDIARATGLTPQTIYDISAGERQFITHDTAERILKLYGPDGPAPARPTLKSPVDAKPYTWKLLCLYAQGWTTRDLRQKLQEVGEPCAFLDGHTTQRPRILYESAKRIDWLVETIGDRHGPSNSNKKRMLKRGIFPLIHYTEDGRLIRGSLTKEQREFLKQVQ